MLPNSPAELCWQSQACPGSIFSRSDDGFVLIQLFPCDESRRPLALANPGGLTYCLHPGRREPPGEHVALQVSHPLFLIRTPGHLLTHQMAPGGATLPQNESSLGTAAFCGYTELCSNLELSIIISALISLWGCSWRQRGTGLCYMKRWHSPTMGFEATSLTSLSLHLFSCRLGVTVTPKSQVI